MLLELPIVKEILGASPQDYTVWQVGLRAFITYFFTIVIVKIGHKRFLGRSTAYDAVLGFILGSVISRAINGQAAFFPTLFGGVVLMVTHYILSGIIFRSKRLSKLVEGVPHVLYQDGAFDEKALRSNAIHADDVKEFMRLTANLDDMAKVKTATIENSGQISIVKAEEPKSSRIVEVKVENGVQIVRIELMG